MKMSVQRIKAPRKKVWGHPVGVVWKQDQQARRYDKRTTWYAVRRRMVRIIHRNPRHLPVCATKSEVRDASVAPEHQFCYGSHLHRHSIQRLVGRFENWEGVAVHSSAFVVSGAWRFPGCSCRKAVQEWC